MQVEIPHLYTNQKGHNSKHTMNVIVASSPPRSPPSPAPKSLAKPVRPLRRKRHSRPDDPMQTASDKDKLLTTTRQVYVIVVVHQSWAHHSATAVSVTDPSGKRTITLLEDTDNATQGAFKMIKRIVAIHEAEKTTKPHLQDVVIATTNERVMQIIEGLRRPFKPWEHAAVRWPVTAWQVSSRLEAIEDAWSHADQEVARRHAVLASAEKQAKKAAREAKKKKTKSKSKSTKKSKRKIHPVSPPPSPEAPKPKAKNKRQRKLERQEARRVEFEGEMKSWHPEDIVVFTDGGARPTNPGPTGSGAVVISVADVRNGDWGKAQKHKKAGGQGTNNTAELNAILLAATVLSEAGDTHRGQKVHIVTDSLYSERVVTGKAKVVTTNLELIKTVRDALGELHLPPLSMKVVIHVCPGHTGVPGNEMADALATASALEN